jgi:RND family efflux transporter MFP subunit
MLSFRRSLKSSVQASTLLALLLAGCAQPAPPPPPAATEVFVAKPLVTPVVEWDEYVGRLEPIDFVEVRARVSGYLDSTNFVEGQIVREGDLLCVIDPRPFEAEVRKAESDVTRAESQVKQAKATVLQVEAEVLEAQAKLDLAKKQLVRSSRLVQQNALSQDEFDVRESDVNQQDANVKAVQARLELSRTSTLSADAEVGAANSSLAIARLNLEYTRIKSPITGRVSSRHVTEGNLISGGAAQSTLITTIVSLNPIHCNFDADESSYLKYMRLAQEGKLGSSREVKHPVYVGLGDEGDQFPRQGHMDFVDNRLDPDTGTMRCRAILANADLSLTPGLFTRVRLPGSGRHDAVLIPDSAIGTDQSDKFVLYVDENSTVARKVVQLGPIIRGLRVVRKGLDGNEQLIVSGIQRVRPDPLVKVVATPAKEPIKLLDDGLPTESQPVPKEQWLSRPEHAPRQAPIANERDSASQERGA